MKFPFFFFDFIMLIQFHVTYFLFTPIVKIFFLKLVTFLCLSLNVFHKKNIVFLVGVHKRVNVNIKKINNFIYT